MLYFFQKLVIQVYKINGAKAAHGGTKHAANVARISIFTGTHDILYPDIRRFDRLLDAKGVAHDTFVFEKMDHVFVAFPLPEARAAQDRVIGLLREM